MVEGKDRWAKERQDFSDRLIKAVEAHPLAPKGHGRQQWLRVTLNDKFGTKYSAEALRKWFNGEARPKVVAMRQIAQVLEVDEAWLSLGNQPDETPREKRQRNAIADGAVNYVAGLIQMSGGHIAFPETADAEADLFAIVQGRQFTIEVKMASIAEANSYRVRAGVPSGDRALLVVLPTSKTMGFDVINVPSAVISSVGKGRGGFVELSIAGQKGGYEIAEHKFKPLSSFKELSA